MTQSVHPPAPRVLDMLIRLGRTVSSQPHRAAEYLPLAIEIEGDVVALVRDGEPYVGPAEGILASSIMQLAGGRLSGVDALRYASIAQHALPLVEDHLAASVAFKAAQQ